MARFERYIFLMRRLILSCLLLATPARADGWFGDYFDIEHNSCYQRIYSKSHLAKHPRQTVTRFFIGHFPQKYVGKEGYEGAVMKSNDDTDILVDIKVRFRNAKGSFSETGICHKEAGKILCGIECDGGGFEIQPRKNGRLLLRTGSKTGGYDSFRVVRNDSCDGDDEYRLITRKTDDKSFLMSRLPPDQCKTPPFGE